MRCPNGCIDGDCPVKKKFHNFWQEVPRLDTVPSRSQYLAHASEKKPFLIPRGSAEAFDWNLDGWMKADYLLHHPSVSSRQHEADAAVAAYLDFRRVRAFQASASDALGLLLKREEQASKTDQPNSTDERLYLTAWEYDPPSLDNGSSPGEVDVDPDRWRPLADDLNGGRVPFLRCLLEESEAGGFQSLAKLLHWLYVSESGTACATHIDPLATQAWMYLTAGRKEWRFVRVPTMTDDVDDAPVDAVGDAYRLDAPDLFDCRAIAESDFPKGASFFHVSLEPGGFLFIPSLVFHAVRNTGPGLTIAVSHNSLDVTCWASALEALSQGLTLLKEEETVAQSRAIDPNSTLRDECLEALAERLDAPLFGLLSVSLMHPEALWRAVSEAYQEVRTSCLEPSLGEKLCAAWSRCLGLLKSLNVAVAEFEEAGLHSSPCCRAKGPTPQELNQKEEEEEASLQDEVKLEVELELEEDKFSGSCPGSGGRASRGREGAREKDQEHDQKPGQHDRQSETRQEAGQSAAQDAAEQDLQSQGQGPDEPKTPKRARRAPLGAAAH